MPSRGRVGSLAVEAYRPAASVEAWAASFLRAFNGTFPVSAGGVARVLDLVTRRPRGGYVLHACRSDVARGIEESERTSANRVDIVAHGRGLRRLCVRPPAALRGDAYLREIGRRMKEVGLSDMRHLTAMSGDVCVSVGVMLPAHASTPGSPAAWSRVAAHFQSALRLQLEVQELRRSLAAGANGALLSPDGRVLDARGDATTELARARLREIARTRRPEGAAGAEEVWHGVVDGTWSVIDRYDADGRRYLLALRVGPGPRDPRRLLPPEVQVAKLAAEGYSDKWIAYTLGIERSTVATHLHSAMRKLGVRTRVELARTIDARTPSPKRLRA